MALISEMTYERILDEMLKKYDEESGFTPDEASDIGIRMKVVATQIHSVAVMGQWILKQMFFNTASGEYLDMHAERHGLQRSPGTKAVGELVFTLSAPLVYRINVPKGLVCVSSDGETRFVTTASGAITAGSTQLVLPAEAQEIGYAGNVASGIVTQIIASPASVLTVSNFRAFAYGSDSETDELLRERIFNACSTPSNGSNAGYYRALAFETEGVRSANVLPRNRGRATVDVYIAGPGGTASSTTVKALQSVYDSAREINVDVDVYAATVKKIDLNIKLKPEFGYDFKLQKQQVETAVNEFFEQLSVGEVFRYNRLGKKLMCDVEGILDYDFGVSESEISLTPKEIAVPGNLIISEWSD